MSLSLAWGPEHFCKFIMLLLGLRLVWIYLQIPPPQCSKSLAEPEAILVSQSPFLVMLSYVAVLALVKISVDGRTIGQVDGSYKEVIEG